MPGLSGISLIQALKSDPYGAQYLETKLRTLGIFIATGESLILGPLIISHNM